MTPKLFLQNTWKHRAHVVMALPAFLVLFFIMYVPMTGLILAFKTYKANMGIYASPWNGINNFKFLITSKDIFFRMTGNTLLYYAVFTILGTLLNVVLAIAIDQFVFKQAAKVMQTIMIIPVFISFAAVQFIVFAFLDRDTGLLNRLFNADSPIPFYAAQAKQYWPVILTIVKIWNSVGYGSVLYMSVLAGIDTEQYEAADIDGANKWQQIIHVTVPALYPMITVMLLLSVGGIMKSDTGIFYQVTRNTTGLWDTTQVIDSYILHSILNNPNYGFTAAASLFQSVVGLLMMLLANGLVRKLEPDNALF